MILAGGRGERLYPLTRDRTKAAVPFGGLYRLIDFTLSNCLHSGLRRLCVLPQYKFASLKRHLALGWNFFRPELGESLEILPPQQRISEDWYQGTADALYQNLYTLRRAAPRYIFVLSSDHVYRMDYRRLLGFHAAREAELTIACVDVAVEEAGHFGIMSVDAEQRVVDFAEKPRVPWSLPGRPDRALASMGIYVFAAETLIPALVEDAGCAASHRDFGRDLIPRLVEEDRRVYAYNARQGEGGFYWRDIGLIDTYWEASMELLGPDPPFDLGDPAWPIHTHIRPLPPARILGEDGLAGWVADALVCNGSQVNDARVERSILSPGVQVAPGAVVVDSVLMDGVSVGPGARVEQAIIDKNVQVPAGCEIGVDLEADQQRFHVSPGGVVVVPKEMELPPAGRLATQLGFADRLLKARE